MRQAGTPFYALCLQIIKKHGTAKNPMNSYQIADKIPGAEYLAVSSALSRLMTIETRLQRIKKFSTHSRKPLHHYWFETSQATPQVPEVIEPHACPTIEPPPRVIGSKSNILITLPYGDKGAITLTTVEARELYVQLADIFG